MKIKTKILVASIMSCLPMTGAFAAALDRSSQPISAFLQPGNYLEFGVSGLYPDVSGTSTVATGNQRISDMAGNYTFYSAAFKFQPLENFSVGLLFDQPFGADAEYSDSSLFTHPTQGNTAVDVETKSVTALVGFQPNENWNLYTGLAYQRISGNVRLRGAAYSIYGGVLPEGLVPGVSGPLPDSVMPAYSAHIPENSAYGWLAGVAYEIPEIALKASVTYRSEIKHEMRADETIVAGIPGVGAIPYTSSHTEITTPQSVNIDLQSGIMADTIAFANIRWVNWKDFSIQPNQFGQLSRHPLVAGLTGKPDGFDLVAYTKDQWSVNAGVGRRFSDAWSGTVSVGWDSGAGDPVTTLGPTEGFWSVGLGAQYSFTPNFFVQAGVRYFWLGDAKAQTGAQFGTGAYVADFEDNSATAFGLKFGYRF